MGRIVKVGGVPFGGRAPLALIAGPCVIESRRACLDLAGRLVRLARDEGIPFVFKASYDKANRTSVTSFRGPGIDEGLDILAEARERFDVPVLTDVHTVEEARQAAKVVDVIQIPAFLCRQTDLLLAAGESGKPVNVKKGQFLSAADMVNVVAKVESTGNRRIIVTERGASFGYNNLVADMRSLPEMAEMGYPVVFDATHSVQRPGGAGGSSSGDARWAPVLARAAVAAGCDGVFIETYVKPETALSDGANAIRFAEMRKLWKTLRAIDEIV
jgi:2-dehydro-3-deoxyphosphooctonate aldolase (KDO 8-P synthase)